jgi:hypothetical protein
MDFSKGVQDILLHFADINLPVTDEKIGFILLDMSFTTQGDFCGPIHPINRTAL